MERKINSRGCVHGFTLIELLVVVSIIALLVSILMPALGKARRQARRVVCTSQMKQYGIATYAYASNNNGYVPGLASTDYPWVGWPEGGWPGDASPLNHCLLMPYMGVDPGLIAKLRSPIPSQYWSGNQEYYMNGFDIFLCPVSNEKQLRVASTMDGKCNMIWTHYVQYCGTTSDAYPGSSDKLAKMKSYIPLYCDRIWANSAARYSAGGFHNDEKGLEGGNGCFVDGSASWRSSEINAEVGLVGMMDINFFWITTSDPSFAYWIPKGIR